MRLVTSMLTNHELSDDQIAKAVSIITDAFNYRYEVFKFGLYEDRDFFDVDIDLYDVLFTRNTLYDQLNKLISVYEKILQELMVDIDFIAANDDTEGEVQIYSKDRNDIKDFGLFVTKRKIPNVIPYYVSKTCNAYVNLKHVSFGVY